MKKISKVSKKLFWISWVEYSSDDRPLTFPPNKAIMGCWRTGYGENFTTICALVSASNEGEAKRSVLLDWPEDDGGCKEWRFCDETSSLPTSCRFPLSPWMADRCKGIPK